MKAWLMSNRSVVAATVWILLANVLIGVGVWLNRSGEPVTEITLTDLELREPSWDRYQGESSSIVLNLYWNNRLGLQIPTAESRFINREVLKDLGFDVSRATDTERGQRFYKRSLPRTVVYAFAYNPDAPLNESQRGNYFRPGQNSRLQLVDVAADAETLRERYADADWEYLFLKGEVRVFIDTNGEPYGRVYQPNVSQLSLPSRFRESYLQANGQYELRVAVGQRLVPWVQSFNKR